VGQGGGRDVRSKVWGLGLKVRDGNHGLGRTPVGVRGRCGLHNAFGGKSFFGTLTGKELPGKVRNQKTKTILRKQGRRKAVGGQAARQWHKGQLKKKKEWTTWAGFKLGTKKTGGKKKARLYLKKSDRAQEEPLGQWGVTGAQVGPVKRTSWQN